MKKINVAELLKDCPSGMELDCTMYDTIFFYEITDDPVFPIRMKRIDGPLITLTKYGEYANSPGAKCVIFPKGKTTWEGFVPPCKFKDGDILTTSIGSIFIFSHLELDRTADRYMCRAYVGIQNTMPISLFHTEQSDVFGPYESMCRFATEEEKQKLFDAIKDNGYKWNSETKTLEKLLKVGDRIRHKDSGLCCTLGEYSEGISAYRTNIGLSITYKELEQWELAPNKFDINTLKPFDKVLVRYCNDNKWCASFLSHIDVDLHSHCCKFVTLAGKSYPKMIPYEGNEHLRGTANDCDDYFKIWEK